MEKLACILLAATFLVSAAVKAEAMSPEYNGDADNVTATQFSGTGAFFTTGQKLDFQLTDRLVGFAGVETVSGGVAASCAAGTCRDATYLSQGVAVGGGFEMGVTDKLSLRFDYEHKIGEPETFAATARNPSGDNAVKAAFIYKFK